MLDFRAAYLPNKYWGRRSVVVPSRPIILDSRFKSLNDLYRDHDRREAFDIYWIEQGVAGNVVLPGELNYAYINGKYYHLEKVSNQGVIDNGGHKECEWGYYLEYDDWQNDWLTNNVHIEGTISKTGSWTLAKANIVQLAPLINGCNNFKFFVSDEGEEEEKEVEGDPNFEYRSIFCPDDVKKFNDELTKKINQQMDIADKDSLNIPLVLHQCYVLVPQNILLQKIYDFLLHEDLKVFDVKKTALNFAGFKTKYKLNKVYCISSKKYHTYEIAEGENQHAKVKRKLKLNRRSKIEHLTTNFTPYQEQGGTTLDELVDQYLKRYPKITSTRDKADFKFIAYEKLFTTFSESLFKVEDKDMERVGSGFYWRGPTAVEEWIKPRQSIEKTWQLDDYGNWTRELDWRRFPGLEYFPSERLLSLNGIYQPGTNPKEIYFIDSIKDETKFRASRTYGNTWNELNGRLMDAVDDNFFTLSRFQAGDNGNEKLKGNLFLSIGSLGYDLTGILKQGPARTGFLEFEPQDFYKAIALLPDYRSRGWVLAESTFIQTHEGPVLTGDIHPHHSITLTRELGEIDATRQTTWMHPQTDTILNNDNKFWSKYAFIIPLMLKWVQKQESLSYDSYGYRFKYELTDKRWKPVKEKGQEEYEQKRLNMVFQFPLSGCGFDIWAILQDYLDLNDRYLRWNFICSYEYKYKNQWEDKGGEFKGFYDIVSDSNNEPKSIEDKQKERHSAFNEAIEIRIYSKAGASLDRVLTFIGKLWAYFFGWKWDGSYNGAVLTTNYGSTEESGFLKILWAKPFNRRWYSCGIWINNYYEYDGLTSGKEISGGWLTYGSGSKTWDPTKNVWAIGYQYANSLEGYDVNYIKDVLTCNINRLSFIYSYTDIKTFNTFSTDHINPNDFYKLFSSQGGFKLSKIKFSVNKPTEQPFKNFELGKRLKDVIRNMTYTTKRSINPKRFNPWAFRYIDDLKMERAFTRSGGGIITKVDRATDLLKKYFNYEIPFFIYKYLNPDSITSKFKHVNFTGTVEQSMEHFSRTLEQELHAALTIMGSTPMIFDLVNSEFVCVATINPLGEWEIELISKTNESIEVVEAKHYLFSNPDKSVDNFEEFVKRLSSQFELVVYGQRIPLKTRPDTTKENIDIGLIITPINDPKQSTTSLWYMVEIRTDQDTQRTRIEVPKELNAMNIQSAYEREHIIRTMLYHSKDRFLENMQQKDEISKYSFDIDLRGQRLDINRNKEITGEIIGMAQTTIQAAQAMGLAGWFGGGAGVAVAGMATGLAGQAANMVYSKQLYDLDKQEHIQHAALGESSLQRKSDLTRSKHELAEQGDRMKLYNMQTNINYPANSDSLIYREENNQFNLSDVYLTQYYPEGDLLNFLINYYQEYGFNVVVPNQSCFGVGWIKRHIQFVKITNNVHENDTIRRMIEERALNGITLDDNSDWHADKIITTPDTYRPQGD